MGYYDDELEADIEHPEEDKLSLFDKIKAFFKPKEIHTEDEHHDDDSMYGLASEEYSDPVSISEVKDPKLLKKGFSWWEILVFIFEAILVLYTIAAFFNEGLLF